MFGEISFTLNTTKKNADVIINVLCTAKMRKIIHELSIKRAPDSVPVITIRVPLLPGIMDDTFFLLFPEIKEALENTATETNTNQEKGITQK